MSFNRSLQTKAWEFRCPRWKRACVFVQMCVSVCHALVLHNGTQKESSWQCAACPVRAEHGGRRAVLELPRPVRFYLPLSRRLYSPSWTSVPPLAATLTHISRKTLDAFPNLWLRSTQPVSTRSPATSGYHLPARAAVYLQCSSRVMRNEDGLD